MKPSLKLSAAALVLIGLPLVAQQVDAAATQSTNVSSTPVASQSAGASVQAGPSSAQANGSASATAEMRPVNTELLGKLDSKSAKAGDAVVVKTTEKVRTADGVVIPKGSHLIGHVADVQGHASGRADSTLSLVFDRAELKGGESIVIHSTIETVAPPAGTLAVASMDGDGSMAMQAPMGGGRAGGGGRLGGGLVGGSLGATSSVAGGAASPLGANTNGTASAVGSTTSGTIRSTASVAGDVSNLAGGGGHEAAGASGLLTAHATGIPGVMLAGDASGSTSGTLTTSRKNIHLDSGTQMLVGVSGAVTR